MTAEEIVNEFIGPDHQARLRRRVRAGGARHRVRQRADRQGRGSRRDPIACSRSSTRWASTPWSGSCTARSRATRRCSTSAPTSSASAASGPASTSPGVFEVRDGKITLWRDYFDMNAMTDRDHRAHVVTAATATRPCISADSHVTEPPSALPRPHRPGVPRPCAAPRAPRRPRRRDARRQRADPRAVLARRGRGSADRGDPSRHRQAVRGPAPRRLGSRGAAGRPGHRRRDRRDHLPVGRDDPLQPPGPRLPERVLRRVQRVDHRVLLVRARPTRRPRARPRCAHPTTPSPTSRRSRRRACVA